VPNQQSEGQLHKQHNIQTVINSQKANYTNSTTYKHKSTARRPITQTAQHTDINNNGQYTDKIKQTKPKQINKYNNNNNNKYNNNKIILNNNNNNIKRAY
jgi:hypothetical protein